MRSTRSRLRLPSHASSQVLRTAVARPLVWARALEPSLGGDHQAVGIRIQGLGDQVLAHLGSVGVGGVDQVDAQLGHAAQQPASGVGVVRSSDAVARDPHRPKPRRRTSRSPPMVKVSLMAVSIAEGPPDRQCAHPRWRDLSRRDSRPDPARGALTEFDGVLAACNDRPPAVEIAARYVVALGRRPAP